LTQVPRACTPPPPQHASKPARTPLLLTPPRAHARPGRRCQPERGRPPLLRAVASGGLTPLTPRPA
jgi:hypothetical protein